MLIPHTSGNNQMVCPATLRWQWEMLQICLQHIILSFCGWMPSTVSISGDHFILSTSTIVIFTNRNCCNKICIFIYNYGLHVKKHRNPMDNKHAPGQLYNVQFEAKFGYYLTMRLYRVLACYLLPPCLLLFTDSERKLCLTILSSTSVSTMSQESRTGPCAIAEIWAMMVGCQYCLFLSCLLQWYFVDHYIRLGNIDHGW